MPTSSLSPPWMPSVSAVISSGWSIALNRPEMEIFLVTGFSPTGTEFHIPPSKFDPHALAVEAGACALAADIAGDDGKGSDGGCVPFGPFAPTPRPKTLGDEAGFVVGDEMGEIGDLLGRESPQMGAAHSGVLGMFVIAGAHDIVHIGGVCRRRFRHRVGIKSDDILVQEGLVVLPLADNDIGDSARQSSSSVPG